MKRALCGKMTLLVGMLLALFAWKAEADEGMWLFNALPKQYLKQKYGFEPTPQWVEHLMLSSVRFNSGGSGSFVSSTGLVLTNHHVAADTLHKISTPEHNYYRDGFYARTLDQEVKAPDLELDQLISIEDVTDRVNAAVTPDMSPAEAMAARRAVIAKIEKESFEKSGLRSDVITLYGGARYHLYRYKRYTDVRLVWAPEADIAFFGGDADNFEYPRYDLDVCLFRVYENGKPAKVKHFLKMAAQPPVEADLVFVSGNPGRTQRNFTVAALKYERDVHVPYALDFLRRREILYQQFGLESEERERRVHEDLFGIQNARKAYTGMLLGLQDPAFMKQKELAELKLKAALAADPKLQHYLEAWDTIEQVQKRQAKLLKQQASLAGNLYQIAQTLVWLSVEDQKPNEQRLPEFRDSARPSLEQRLFSPAPIYKDLEQTKLADSLSLMIERRGGDDPLVKKVLAGKSPTERAAELVQGTKLADVAVRKRLAKLSPDKLKKCQDPLIQLAWLLEPEARQLRKERDELQELLRQAYAQITAAKFAVLGTNLYPDATFTLRLAFGQVKGYKENGREVPAWTTLGGAFEHERRHGAKPPWKLPPRWHQCKDKLNLNTPLNFVCTADIIGGNSGSPVVNRKGELVGVIFDGNIYSLTLRYAYSDRLARAVSVNISALLETLPKIYNAAPLAEELGK